MIPVSPNGCRHCGQEERGHGQQWIIGVGWHQWAEPTDEQRLARMRARAEFSRKVHIGGPLVTLYVLPDGTQAELLPTSEPDHPMAWVRHDSLGSILIDRTHLTEIPPSLPQEPPKPCPEGFHWIGQSGAWCDKCGLPSWEHDGMATVRRPASPYDETPWVLDPWKPGEREVMRRKWEPDLLAQQAETAAREARSANHNQGE